MKEQYGVKFEAVYKKFGAETIISSLDMDIRSGERLVLLGPSGCGKTTVMRLIAGLEQPTGGNIYMGGNLVNGIDASERNVAMVFQNYALYPHMTVFENMSFSLKLRKLPKTEIVKRIQDAAEKLALAPYLKRKPRELSGGQRQRVALGRAIVQQSPYFLLDEPLSNLDAQLRISARNELVELHETYPSTMVYVTHDQVEAMTIGQRIAVLYKGQIQQIGTPDEIYKRPANRFVATFVGNPPMNIFPVQITDSGFILAGQKFALPAKWTAEWKIREGQEVLLGIRPESIMLRTDFEADGLKELGGVAIKGQFVRGEYLGSIYVYHAAVGEHRLQIATPYPINVSSQADVSFIIPFEHIHFFESGDREQRIPLSIQPEENRQICGHELVS